jgi:hypothetical protein
MINKNNIQEYILLDVDNELTIAEQNKLHQYLQLHVDALAQWQMAKEAVLVADEEINLKLKINLYAIANKQVAPMPIWNIRLKVVASIALLIACGIGLYQYGMYNAISDDVLATTPKTIIDVDTTKAIANNNSVNFNNTTNYDTTIKIVKKDDVLSKSNVHNIINQKSEVTNQNNIYKNNANNANQNVAIHQQNFEIVTQPMPEIQLIPSIDISPIIAMQAVPTNIDMQTIITIQKINLPESIAPKQNQNAVLSFNLPTTHFFDNNKAYQFFKKVNNTLAFINTERKNIKENGVQLEVELPEIFNKKLQ